MYFFDTYAIFEILNQNPAYYKYKDETITTSVLNIGELYYGLLKETKTKADIVMEQIHPELINIIDQETIKKAMLFRYHNRKRKLSMIDCIGYMLAKKIGAKFLTGDKEFKNFSNVEFVK